MQFKIGDRVRLKHQLSRELKIDRRQRGTVVGVGDDLGLVLFVSFERVKQQGRQFNIRGTIAVCVSSSDLVLWQ